MAIYTLLSTGLVGTGRTRAADTLEFLPDNIYDAIARFQASDYVAELLGESVKERYIDAKLASAERCPHRLGTVIKRAEVQFHHEVTNQYLWGLF
jgi:glutamine synthetase